MHTYNKSNKNIIKIGHNHNNNQIIHLKIEIGIGIKTENNFIY